MKRIIYLLLILSSCTVHRFTTLESFDKPEYETRDFDPTVTAIYDGTYDNIFDEYNSFTFIADSLTASQLKTKQSISFIPPFTVSVRAKMRPANLALYCPLWLYPVSDLGGFKVREYDIVESFKDKTVLTAHLGDDGYGNHKSFPKYIDVVPDEWHKYKMKVEVDRVRWWVDGKLMHEVNEYFGTHQYFLWISIIMSTNYQDNNLPDEARMDIKNLKVIK